MRTKLDSITQVALNVSGITRVRWAFRASGLYVFTFHRIGSADQSPFDPNVFSCNASEFERIVDFIQAEFDVVGLSDLSSLMSHDRHGKKRAALITFDDGYIDNYRIAMPILAERGLGGIFFVATSMVEGAIPWWDKIAFWTRTATVNSITLGDARISLRVNKKLAIRSILRAFKEDPSSIEIKTERFHDLLRPEQSLPDIQLMMDWDQLQEASRAGFTIGSHTVNHPILSHLDPIQQRFELSESKAILEAELGCTVNALAIPVGGETSFTPETLKLARAVGYKHLFSSIEMRNSWDTPDPMYFGRVGIDSGQTLELKYRISKLR